MQDINVWLFIWNIIHLMRVQCILYYISNDCNQWIIICVYVYLYCDCAMLTKLRARATTNQPVRRYWRSSTKLFTSQLYESDKWKKNNRYHRWNAVDYNSECCWEVEKLNVEIKFFQFYFVPLSGALWYESFFILWYELLSF